MLKSSLLWRATFLFVCAVGAFCTSSVSAKVVGPRAFCEVYPEVADCQGKLPTCSMCHLSTSPPSWNDFGTDVFDELLAYGITMGTGYNFSDHYELYLPVVLPSLSDIDSDCDGRTNYEELLVGTNPGLEQSVWIDPPVPVGEPNPWYSVGQYDHKFAFKRLSTVFCGKSADYDEVQAFLSDVDSDTPEGKSILGDRIHAKLSTCLDSDYWRKTALRSLADNRIRPLKVAGKDSSICLILADYDWDYRLWEWIMTEDRSMQELLTAQYHVALDEAGNLEKVGLPSGPFGGAVLPDPLDPADPESYCPNNTVALKYPYPIGPGQPLAPEKRAGMITTQWFLMINTMFSALPRTTAAQAARSYIGFDIAQSEGLNPVSEEPLDIDNKGVDQAPCSYCHSTLDPLSYAFAFYDGISGFTSTGNYNVNRPPYLMPDWDPLEPPQAVILGSPVVDLVEWAQVAVASEDFIRHMGQELFRFALDRDPSPDEASDFVSIWQAMPADGYSANKFFHRLVDLNAFGAP